MTNLLRDATTTKATCPRFGVCLSEPTFPDLSRLSPNSHLGRKLRRKAVDAYCVAHRQWQGRPAKSGPPVPNSEKHGRRDFYTLGEAKRGGIKSGVARRNKAAAKWRAVTILAKRGKGVRQIARIVGYSAGCGVRALLNTVGCARRPSIAWTRFPATSAFPGGVARTYTPPRP